MTQRTFQIEHEWCMIHCPEKPNGFAVMILGDQQHFVEENQSFWTQNIGRAKMIEELTSNGYTVFYSNLYGKNWGSTKAAELAQTLYHLIMKQEILNEKIHVIAEGMGALAAIELITMMKGEIRSVSLISPCLSLKKHVEQEKEKKFFYKRIVQELINSHEINENQIEELLKTQEGNLEKLAEAIFPMVIIKFVERSRYDGQQELINQTIQKRKDAGLPISFHYLLPEKRTLIPRKMLKEFHHSELDL
ncbi:hydrolase [Falsibacillus pallidus]|uniref:Hydrolase n=1 Tax=Falsibacillus pallidus TaxID=493781 RepID=A0A370GVV4_9BACI|nr:hydrolase [Falsibacillus pallidus]RDI47787.1 hypothetical protein DFR59_101452 [Falsibacillus pallidus]